jgi:hypothetical protein
MKRELVRLDARAVRCWPWLPASAPSGSWWQSLTGELVQVLEDGTAEPLEGFRSVAEDPFAARRPGAAGRGRDVNVHGLEPRARGPAHGGRGRATEPAPGVEQAGRAP